MSVEHTLSQSEALKRIKRLLAETKKTHRDLIDNLKEKWVGNIGTFKLSAKGYDLAGTLTVDAPLITIEAEVPWALSFMKGKVEKMIKSRAKKLLV